MNVLVDTCVWSLALRRVKAPEHPAAQELADLVTEGRALLTGLIRQELLSGVRGTQQFESLRGHLQAFPDLRVETADHEEAARFFNRCRAKGVQGSTTDFLLCALAHRRELAILTTDDDFNHYARILSVGLHAPRTHE